VADILIHGRSVEERKDHFLRVLPDCKSMEEAYRIVGVSRQAVGKWRERDISFAKRLQAAIKIYEGHKATLSKADLDTVDVFRAKKKPPPLEEFRKKIFGFPSNESQQAFCRAYDDKTNLAIFWIAPAGWGKDVTAMQSIAHAAADGILRMGCLMENERQAKKRIDSYLDPYFTDPLTFTRAPDIPGGTQPTRNFIEEWGPFKWDSKLRLPNGDRVPQLKWEAHNKWFVGRTTPMADPSLWAVGLGSAIAGSRVQYMVASDIFTVENQRQTPDWKKDQLDLVLGTIDSRLDEAGRIVFLNHHVASEGDSNLTELLERYIGQARVVEVDGDYTKYSNGVATIITPALRLTESGEEESTWPERFPVRDTIILPNGEKHTAFDLTDEELADLSQKGGRRIRGLVERRGRIGEDLFGLIYQQNPAVSAYGDFTWEILDGCDLPDRSLGDHQPGETLILGVDPARSGGAGWVLWALDEKAASFTLVDFWWGEGLGFTGMREMLIREPVERWRPRYLVWEINFEGETAEHPDAREILRRHHVNYVPHRTLHNRTEGKHSVISMLDDMRDRLIRFPAQTPEDQAKCRRVKEHFVSFESAGYTERRSGKARSRLPDDLCMAAWVGWRYGHSLLKSRKRRSRRPNLSASGAVRDAFTGFDR
jgi:hypothetical protein